MGDDVSSKPSEDSPGFLADVQASAGEWGSEDANPKRPAP